MGGQCLWIRPAFCRAWPRGLRSGTRYAGHAGSADGGHGGGTRDDGGNDDDNARCTSLFDVGMAPLVIATANFVEDGLTAQPFVRGLCIPLSGQLVKWDAVVRGNEL